MKSIAEVILKIFFGVGCLVFLCWISSLLFHKKRGDSTETEYILSQSDHYKKGKKVKK